MKNKLYKLSWFFIFILSLNFIGCDDEKDPGEIPFVKRGVIVVNEGLWQQNNSSLTYYDLQEQKAYQNVYSTANNGAALGETANSIFIYENKGYIAVTGSNKIEIINLEDFRSLGKVDLSYGGKNREPRHIVILNPFVGYATCLGTNTVVKFNPSTKQTIKEILVGDKPEGIAYAKGKLFVCNSGYGMGNTVSVIDANKDSVISSIKVRYNPQYVLATADENILVLSSADFRGTIPGAFFKINSQTLAITDSIEAGVYPIKPIAINSDEILFININGVYKLKLSTKIVSKEPIVSAFRANPIFGAIYSIAFDSKENKLYVGNPKDFVQNGEILIYSLQGDSLGVFNCGINPGTIAIKN